MGSICKKCDNPHSRILQYKSGQVGLDKENTFIIITGAITSGSTILETDWVRCHFCLYHQTSNISTVSQLHVIWLDGYSKYDNYSQYLQELLDQSSIWSAEVRKQRSCWKQELLPLWLVYIYTKCLFKNFPMIYILICIFLLELHWVW